MLTFISFIVVLGILIFIHEFGHFTVAKLSGVSVEKFSLGFGPKIVGFTKGETEYRISALPLGGYVKMLGESPGEEIQPEELKRSFSHKPVGVRAAIVAAGPIMNLVLAAVLFPVIFMIGIQAPAFLDKPAEVGFVVPDEPASKAGIKKGDLIHEVNEKKIKNWEDLMAAMALNPKSPLKIEAERGGATFKTVLTPQAAPDTGAGYAGMLPPMKPIIGDVAKGYPAEAAGLKPGDLILSVDGTEVTHWAELEDIIHKSGNDKNFTVSRDDKILSFTIKPKFNSDMKVFLVGISRKEEVVKKKYSPVEAVQKGILMSFQMTGRLFDVIKGLVFGKYSLKTLGGPIMIAQVAGKAAHSGVADLLSLVAFLSLQLGIINLFPIPVLDGGHLLFFGIESISGKPLSEKVMSIAQQIGIALLIALMVLVTYNDLFRIFG